MTELAFCAKAKMAKSSGLLPDHLRRECASEMGVEVLIQGETSTLGTCQCLGALELLFPAALLNSEARN